tara:strand:+ start:792 stop:1043 length:252 start_codon:yes stop_codon:yes gene_type:complete
MAEKKDKKKKKVAVETIAGLGTSAVAGGLGIKKLADVMSKNVKTGRGGSFTQFGVTGKRGAEKFRKSPFELKNGGLVNFKGIF